ncbi:MAG: GNAT family N-acetyltransferase [Nitrospiraceae bacterium]|nr:GNAT family N-acetyltransferase [Nitrospiraceae bacterium]
MLFADDLTQRLEEDPAIRSHMPSFSLHAPDVWSLDLRADWEGVGPICVRPTELEDHAALHAFVTQGLGEQSRFLFAPYPLDERLDATIRGALEATCRREQLTFNAMQEDRVVGHFFLWEFTEPIPELGIAVADEFQGNKLGHLFMNVLIAAAQASGKRKVELTTHPTNEAGFHLYSKMGFSDVGDKTITLGDGSQRSEREMKLDFNSGC